MVRAGKSLSRNLRNASSQVRSVASGLGLPGRIKLIQSMLCEMRARRPGIVRVLDSIGVRVVAPWSRDREALVERAPRSFESAMGHPTDGHHVLHATIVGPGGFAVVLRYRTSPLRAHSWCGAAAPLQ